MGGEDGPDPDSQPTVEARPPAAKGSAAPTEPIPDNTAALLGAQPIDSPSLVDALVRPRGAIVTDRDRGDLPRGTTLGRYILIDRIARGGMGVVYAAYDPELHRRIALKLLLPELSRSGHATAGRARLLREAQAMARLSHPNVISVHDVGTVDDHVFLALELVDGDNLARWLRTPRTWREVLAVYLAAGRGLAAAHAAGLVHRDFKPDNVLVGKDGRVLVTDFGLARAEGDDTAEADTVNADDDPPAARGSAPSFALTPLSTPLTRVGSVMGTVGYAAPEHLRGRPCDARSDQFSFAVAVWGGLFRERPFAGKTFLEYTERLAAGPPTSPANTGVPGRIRAAVARGLAIDPAARFPSMDALLAELARDPGAQRRRLLVAGGIVAAMAAAVGATMLATAGDDRGALCTGAERKLAGVWDGARKDQIRTAFAATDQPYAELAFAGAARRLDDRAAAWTWQHTEACEATRIRGEQPESVMALRIACLDGRLRELGQLVDVLAAPDRTVVERAVQAAGSLSPLEDCADVSRLLAAVAPPSAARRDAVDALRATIGRIKALGDAGKYKEAAAIAQTAITTARAIGYRPALAEALVQLGEIQVFLGDGDATAATLREAAHVADAAGHDAVRSRALAWLVGVIGADLEHGPDGLLVADDARAALERMGGDPRTEAILESSLGRTYSVTGDYHQMLEHHTRSLEIRRRVLGDDDPQTANASNNVAAALHELGRIRESLAEHRRTLAMREKVLGSQHPAVAMSLTNIGSQLIELGDLADGLSSTDAALAIARQTLPARSAVMLGALVNRAGALADLGRYDEAQATYAELFATLDQDFAKSLRRARALANRAMLLEVPTGHAREALADARLAAELATAASSSKSDDVALALVAQSYAHEALADRPAALAAAREALAIDEKTFGADGTELIDALDLIARLAPPDEATAAATRALGICEKAGLTGKWLARSRFALARTLVRTDRDQALALARQARDWYATSPLTADLAAIDAWLAAR